MVIEINGKKYDCEVDPTLIINNATEVTLSELKKLKDSISELINATPDGFFYVANIHCYGRYSQERYNNIYAAKEAEVNSNEGDSYLIDIYTNNPDAKEFSYVKTEGEIPNES